MGMGQVGQLEETLLVGVEHGHPAGSGGVDDPTLAAAGREELEPFQAAVAGSGRCIEAGDGGRKLPQGLVEYRLLPLVFAADSCAFSVDS
jgi:hypothetical protein